MSVVSKKDLSVLSHQALLIPAKADQNNPCLWLPLWIHSADTAEIMDKLFRLRLSDSVKAVLDSSLGEDDLRRLCVFLAAVHDIGKATPAFFSKINRLIAGMDDAFYDAGFGGQSGLKDTSKSPHALAGESVLLSKGCPDSVAAVIGAHHGKPQDIGIDCAGNIETYWMNYSDRPKKKIWSDIRDEYIVFALSASGFVSLRELPALSMPAQVLLTGLLITADWIASNTEYFPLISTDSADSETVDIEKRVRDAWARLAFPEPWAPKSFSMDGDDFKIRFGFLPRPAQSAIVRAVETAGRAGIYILEAPMGSGKTEAALGAAELLASRFGCGGLYFGLPTQATADGIFPRLEKWCEAQSREALHAIRLAHGMAMYNDDYRLLLKGNANMYGNEDKTGLIAHQWFDGKKQALLADFVIGTVDQFLQAALKQKHVMLRHLGLAGKAVIIDECHAYDAYMNQYLDMSLTWMGAYGVPVIILSATLPAQRRAQLIDAYLNRKPGKYDQNDPWRTSRGYPLLTYTDGNEVKQEQIPTTDPGTEVRITRVKTDSLPLLLRDKLSGGGCAGVIVNTVRRAQGIAEKLKEALPDKKILVIHAGYLMPDRSEKEKELLRLIGKQSVPEDRNGLIVVGTQVLEQSLDIDFDILATDLCPMDLLLQRIGRLHRHMRYRPDALKDAECLILEADGDRFESGAHEIYGDWLLGRTNAILPGRIVIPKDIPDLVQDVYDDELNDETLPAKKQYDKKRSDQIMSAREYRVSAPISLKEHPQLNTIEGWLDTEKSDIKAEAAVRDGNSSIEVIVLRLCSDGKIRFLGNRYGGAEISADHVPSEEECLKIVRQRLRLPTVFASDWQCEKAVEQLERNLSEHMPEWQQSRILKGELFLLLDDDMKAELCGYRLGYSYEKGLSYDKED